MENRGNIIIHYQRADSDYKNWALWLWEFPQGQGKEFYFNGEDSFGITATFPLSLWSNFVLYNNLGLIVKSTGSWDKKDGADKIIKFYKMTPDENGNYHVYVKQDDDNLYSNLKLDKIETFAFAKFTNFKTVETQVNDLVIEYNIKCNGEIIKEEAFLEPVTFIKCELEKEIDLDNEYIIEVRFAKNGSLIHKRIRFYDLYKLDKFKKLYSCDEELGAICSENSTTFKVWSPVSKKIILRVYKSGTPIYYDPVNGNDEIIIEQEMVKQKNGVFSLVVSQNLHGYYYNYVVTNDAYKNREITDIYAKSSGINGIRGMIVDFKKIDCDDLSKIKIHPYKPESLVVYETHIADLTSSKTWTQDKEKRKFEKTFLGACLEGTFYSENGVTVKTGFDHIKELGVNAVQFLPIFDQANDEGNMTYNWGYNPVNYNVLEGGYSTNPYDGEVRIKEFKHLVKKYHDAGINIIMDVVFNHVNGATGSSFDVLMPGYYFRYIKDYVFANGSGCGNETASEMPMFRKFMIDSVLFYAKEYKIAGFRFDLMGIHDLDTMNELVKKLHEFDKNIIVYGEPWAACCPTYPGEKLASKSNISKFKKYGFFNDSIREALVRATKNQDYCGWILGRNYENDFFTLSESIKGNLGALKDSSKIVNYASCHDNRTLVDRITYNGFSYSDAKKAAMLANAIVLTSKGISFILAGEEFLRSKKGFDNSYNLSYEINELDYSLLIKNNDMFKNYQKLINLKKNILGKDTNKITNLSENKKNLLTYELVDKSNKKIYKIFHLNSHKNTEPIVIDLAGYELYLDTINSHKYLSYSTSLIPFETLIVIKYFK